ncbi:MAG: Metal-dependent hydrolase [Candidatus Alkanophagales archaeon MCA70_species_2]|nr:Metal-dependent hydrolase [Candidatus Alkanophaga liquidiphilum]
MMLKITTLCDNVAAVREGILAEHGFSALIETEDVKILFDTGQSISVVNNADVLGVSLDVDAIVLSHGHYDHTGGLLYVLRRLSRGGIRKTRVIAHPDIFQKKYVVRDGKERYVGIPYAKDKLESFGARFELQEKALRLSSNVMTTGEVKRVVSFEKGDKSLYVRDSGLKQDEVRDDQALVIDLDERGLFVVLGCAHAGMINTLEHALELTGASKIYGVVGGTHLLGASERRINETLRWLKRHAVSLVGVSHCTSMRVALKFAEALKEKFLFNAAGTVLSVE